MLDTGEPFPTRYWLTCPLAVKRVSDIESQGGVRAYMQRLEGDARLSKRLEEVHQRYAADRDAEVPDDAPHRPSGGVGGSRGGVKCLHAHVADYLAGNDNPIGDSVASAIEPIDCRLPCVTLDGSGATRNPEWSARAAGITEA